MNPSPAQPKPPGRDAAVVSLDARALAKLHELDPDGQLGVVRRVLVAFESSLVRMLAQLSAQSAAQRDTGAALDTAQITLIAHTIKSSAASLGATQLSQACADTERRCRQGDFSAMQHDLQRLLVEGAAALVAVRAMLAG